MPMSDGGRFELWTEAAVFVDGCFYLIKPEAGAAIELVSKRVEIFYFCPK